MSTAKKVAVVKTESANLASVIAGLRRAGAEVKLTEDSGDVESYDYVVLPGVGALGAAKARLDALGMVEVLRNRAQSGRPLFAVCVGLQLLLEGSEESSGVPGLCAVGGFAQRFPESVRVPQLGWNVVTAQPNTQYLVSGEFYFANSYRLIDPPQDCAVATAEHGGSFVAGFERRGLLACQFHPELSSKVGAEVIHRWLTHSLEASAC